MFTYLGLVLVLFSWIAGIYMVAKWRGTKAMSISEHAASSKQASLLFAAILNLCGAAFFVWIIVWLAPKLELGPVFVIIVVATFFAQFVAGLVPDVPGFKRIIHRSAAYGMALLFLPLSLIMLTSTNISSLGRMAGIACFSYLIVSCLLFLFVPKAKNSYLVFQALYIIVLQSQILLIAYTL